MDIESFDKQSVTIKPSQEHGRFLGTWGIRGTVGHAVVVFIPEVDAAAIGVGNKEILAKYIVADATIPGRYNLINGARGTLEQGEDYSVGLTQDHFTEVVPFVSADQTLSV